MDSADALCDVENQQVHSSSGLPAVSYSDLGSAVLMRNVEQEAYNSKRNSEESDVVLKNQQMVRVQQMATVEWIQQKRKDKDSVDDMNIYQQIASTSSWYLELAIAKRCRLHKLIRQRFAFALWIQQMLFAMRKTSRYILLVGYQQLATVILDHLCRKDPDATITSAAAQRRVKSGQLRRRNDTHLLQCNQRSKWKESMAEIKSCKLPQFKGTRFLLFWEIVQFTEEVCTEMERRQFGLDKRRTYLNSLSNGHIRTEGIYTRRVEERR
ncbi:separase-like [Dorcoceras hygrometricum]|uniref:Separase-like n=1 Tax=Dorcoceras hygrometricum TaxID=472368 RepID=A0A2Z7BKQ1_9LAMI|nr:separase-like [Dorcoceras hygrometricum]